MEWSLHVKLKNWMSNSVDPDETWIYVVCKMLLLLPVAVKELKNILLFVSRFVFLPIYGYKYCFTLLFYVHSEKVEKTWYRSKFITVIIFNDTMFDQVTNVQSQNDSFCEMASACTIANGSRSPITLVYYPFLEEAWCPEEQTGSHKTAWLAHVK